MVSSLSHTAGKCLSWDLNSDLLTPGVQFSSFQLPSHVRHCNPMNRSTPGLPVHRQLPESTQTHVHWVGDDIQPSHPLLSPCPPALSLSQHQSLFKWVSSSHQVAKVLELQHQSSKLAIRSLISLDPGIIVDIKQTSGYMHSILEAVECWRHNRNITSLSERWTSCS